MMTWKEFAVKIFDIEDADPGYMMLGRAPIPLEQKQRFMVAWCAYYNPGIAAAASEHTGKAFWQYLERVYVGAKRASERRHFRGDAGRNALKAWQVMFPRPESMITYMQGKSYLAVRDRAKKVVQIGDYFVWKFADVQERVFRVPCYFEPKAAGLSPKVPQQGAKLINPDQTVAYTYEQIADYMNQRGMRSPPWNDRPMNMQEAETVCCVYKQYRNGKWAPFTRTAKATRSLLAMPSETADIMLDTLHSSVTHVRRKEMNAWQAKILSQLGS